MNVIEAAAAVSGIIQEEQQQQQQPPPKAEGHHPAGVPLVMAAESASNRLIAPAGTIQFGGSARTGHGTFSDLQGERGGWLFGDGTLSFSPLCVVRFAFSTACASLAFAFFV